MHTRKWLFVLILITFICTKFSSASAEKLTQEQMTAYRTIPAVVLIYSGMYVKVSLKNGQTIQIPYYGSGSGFFINSEGYLVTNGHVVASFLEYNKDKPGYANKVAYNYFINSIIAQFKKAAAERLRIPRHRPSIRGLETPGIPLWRNTTVLIIYCSPTPKHIDSK